MARAADRGYIALAGSAAEFERDMARALGFSAALAWERRHLAVIVADLR